MVGACACSSLSQSAQQAGHAPVEPLAVDCLADRNLVPGHRCSAVQGSSVVEVSRDSMYMRPKDNWSQWVLPEEQRDKTVHVVVQQAVAASTDAQQQQQVHSPRHKKGGHKEGHKEGPTSPKAAAAPPAAEQQQAQEAQQQQPKEALGAAEAKEPAAAAAQPAAEPAAPAAEQPPAAAEPAAASVPPPAPSTGVRKIDEDEEMNEDDMFELDEVGCACWLVGYVVACSWHLNGKLSCR